MTGEPSGIDLARQALLAAQEAPKKNGAGRAAKPKRRTTTAVRRDGREPLGLGAAIGMMMTERGLVAPAAGGSVSLMMIAARALFLATGAWPTGTSSVALPTPHGLLALITTLEIRMQRLSVISVQRAPITRS
ncbi:hypothetical protein AB0G74_16645 [Streptomyces sp. NPDC020875]|uniref:hypothetical protein n=1 Tax=Streptomyces sp. NPDC020875 TaxID=3154898 RepID=UPI003401E734